MADVISFGNGVDTSGPSAMLRTIFRHIRERAADDVELMLLVSREQIFDAQGGWFFDELSLSAFEQLRSVLDQIEAELPDSISNWYEAFRPSFHTNFAKFSRKLAERIQQLSMEARVKGM